MSWTHVDVLAELPHQKRRHLIPAAQETAPMMPPAKVPHKAEPWLQMGSDQDEMNKPQLPFLHFEKFTQLVAFF